MIKIQIKQHAYKIANCLTWLVSIPRSGFFNLLLLVQVVKIAFWFFITSFFLVIRVVEIVHVFIVKVPQSFMAFFSLFVLIDPFLPVTLNILRLFVLFGESWPVWLFGIFFGNHKHHLKTCFAPLRFLLLNFFVKLDLEFVLFAVRLALKLKNIVFQVYFLVLNVSKS